MSIMTNQGVVAAPPPARETPLPGARMALILLLAINLFNYIDRQVLAAVVPKIRATGLAGGADQTGVAGVIIQWLKSTFGFSPDNALIGSLGMAFMVTYMLLAPVFGWLAERTSRWWLVGAAVVFWSLA